MLIERHFGICVFVSISAVPRWLPCSSVCALSNNQVLCSNNGSLDMLEMVASRSASYNNSAQIADSPALSTAKLWYYKIFAKIYGLCGSCADLVMVLVIINHRSIQHGLKGI